MNTSRETDYVNGSEEHFTVSDIRKSKGLNQKWIILRQRQHWVQYEERMANTKGNCSIYGYPSISIFRRRKYLESVYKKRYMLICSSFCFALDLVGTSVFSNVYVHLYN